MEQGATQHISVCHDRACLTSVVQLCGRMYIAAACVSQGQDGHFFVRYYTLVSGASLHAQHVPDEAQRQG